MDSDTGQQDVITVFEAYMPFLESFFGRYFTENDRLARERAEYKQVTASLVDTLLTLLDKLAHSPSFANKKRITDVKDLFLILIDKVRPGSTRLAQEV